MPEEVIATNSDNSPIEVIASKELKVLLAWKAPSRPFKRRDKEFWTTVIAIVFLVGLILIFVREWFLIAAIIALTFVYYVLSTVEPEEMEYKITNKGIIYAGATYPFENLTQFWFSEKYGQKIINFDLRGGGIVGRITILLGNTNEKQIKDILVKYLLEEEPKPTFMDNASNWLQEKVSLEGENKTKNPPITASNK